MSAENKRADAIKAAKSRNESVVFANDFMVQLDLDSREGFDAAMKGISLARSKRMIYPGMILRTNGRSGRGYHVYIHLNAPMGLVERISLQGMLGSDPTRELLNLSLAVSMPKDEKPGKRVFYEPFLFEKADARFEVIQIPADDPAADEDALEAA